jgi:hypothetical protein
MIFMATNSCKKAVMAEVIRLGEETAKRKAELLGPKSSPKAIPKFSHQKTPSKERYEFLTESPRPTERPSGDKVAKCVSFRLDAILVNHFFCLQKLSSHSISSIISSSSSSTNTSSKKPLQGIFGKLSANLASLPSNEPAAIGEEEDDEVLLKEASVGGWCVKIKKQRN